MRAELPEPSAEETAHSERLRGLIRDEIAAAGGSITFERYMELALYAPGLGYYSAGATKFGRAGDFVTSTELGFVFARCLANAIAPMLRETRGAIVELGPGSGALAAELLLELERLDALPSAYRLLERSADLRERQRETLSTRCAHLAPLATWLDAPSDAAWNGVLIANEVLDALPVRAFEFNGDRLLERRVGFGDAGRFTWRAMPADAALSRAIDRATASHRAAWPQPYRSEICATLAPWFAEVTRTMQRGAAWMIDYGYPRTDYYSPQRREGTLRCHYRHRAHDDPLILTGLQDITAWVDFDALADAAIAAGFVPDALITQSEFLVANGVADVFDRAYAAAADETRRYRLAQEVKTLMMPGEMGEAFRVLVLRR